MLKKAAAKAIDAHCSDAPSARYTRRTLRNKVLSSPAYMTGNA